MFVAVHEVPQHAVNIDPDTGVVDISADSRAVDPLGGEVFDTPEFADSAEGHLQNATNSE
jgi:choline/glycine/proline betaine transport protein